MRTLSDELSEIESHLADTLDEVTHYDVLVRPDGGDPVDEAENLTLPEAVLYCAAMQLKYPTAIEDWQLLELLS